MLYPMIIRLAVLCLLTSPVSAVETKAPAPPPPEDPHVMIFGENDHSCLEWSNACQVCIRNRPQDETQCSTMGFSCIPAPIICRRR